MADPRRQTRRELMGALCILVLLVVAFGIFFIDVIRHALERNYELNAVFREAPRLRAGSQVWVAGRLAGRVLAVELLPPARDTSVRVAVQMELTRAVRDLVRHDSEMHFTKTRLIGEPVIDIAPGSSSARVLEAGDTLRNVYDGPDPAELMEYLTAARASLDSLLVDAPRLMARIDRRSAELGRVRVEAARASAEMRELQLQLTQSDGTLAHLLDDGGWRSSVERIQGNAGRIADAVGRAQQRANESLGQTAPVRARLTRNVAELQRQLAAIQAMMSSPTGVRGRMKTDSALVKAIHGAQAQMDSLMAEAKKKPLRFVF